MSITPFKSFKVSTKTYIAHTNLVLDIENIFDSKVIPITSYIVIQKKRGRKKKTQEDNPNIHVCDGSIIRIQHKKNFQGVNIKSKSKGYFRNAMTVVIMIDDKLINFKTSRKGKFQITGCKSEEHAEKCILYFWKYIMDFKNLYTLDGDYLKVHYEPVMYNIDFSIGFKINRENLDLYINSNTIYTSLFETTFGYTGVNIKMPVKNDYNSLLINIKEYCPQIKSSTIPYGDFILKNKIKKKDLKYNTFLVFQSGKVIMSGKDAVFMENSYIEFLKIINESSLFIKEVLI